MDGLEDLLQKPRLEGKFVDLDMWDCTRSLQYLSFAKAVLATRLTAAFILRLVYRVHNVWSDSLRLHRLVSSESCGSSEALNSACTTAAPRMGMMKLHFGNGSKSLRRVAGGRRCYRVGTVDEYSSLLFLIDRTGAGTCCYRTEETVLCRESCERFLPRLQLYVHILCSVENNPGSPRKRQVDAR